MKLFSHLHKVRLTLESVLKAVVVVISNVPPIDGVSLLLGNIDGK